MYLQIFSSEQYTLFWSIWRSQIIKDVGNNKIEVVMINPVRLLNIVENKELEKIAKQVKAKYMAILENL